MPDLHQLLSYYNFIIIPLPIFLATPNPGWHYVHVKYTRALETFLFYARLYCANRTIILHDPVEGMCMLAGGWVF
jgi:hypothetical protein